MDIRALDERALAGTARVVERVTEDRLAASTPCAEWDLRALLVHMAGNNNGFADAAAGKPAEPAVWEGSEIAGDPVDEYQESSRRVSAAFGAAGALEHDYEVYGFGSYPAEQAIGMHFIDYLVHGWDVAMAIGIEYVLDPELCLIVLRMGRRWPAGAPTIWGPDAPFGYPVPVDDDAPPDRRMLGFLGREPNWSTV